MDNSLEFVKMELIRRGFNTGSTTAKAIPAVIDIVANTDRNWQDYAEALQDLEAQRANLENVQYNWQRKISSEQWKAERDQEEAKKVLADAEAKAAKIYQCETPEARDRMRMALFFVENTDVDTKYDNTAFIRGLGAILGSSEEATE